MDIALTADLGNSRLKVCAWSLADGQVVDRAAFDVTAAVGEQAARFARRSRGLSAIALSSVAAPEREAEVARALADLGAHFELAPDPGLVLDVREPARVGRDRLYAARGALESAIEGDTGFLVVDAGTALTVDAVVNGRFLGGAIAPGPRLLARALAEHTARLPLVDPVPGGPALGRDTESAVRAGVVVGFRGAARELAACVAREAGIERASVIVTGGARSLLGAPSVFDAASFRRVHEDEDLVHRGLLAALRAAIAR